MSTSTSMKATTIMTPTIIMTTSKKDDNNVTKVNNDGKKMKNFSNDHDNGDFNDDSDILGKS